MRGHDAKGFTITRPASTMLAVFVWIACPMIAKAQPEHHLTGGAVLQAVGFADLPGWRQDDARAAFNAFLKTCDPIISGAPALRTARTPSPELIAACKTALHANLNSNADAHAFFENHF
ncbi:MAG: hypothetical protein ACRCYS_02535, partial [Beijerinckiaceae bacterium]